MTAFSHEARRSLSSLSPSVPRHRSGHDSDSRQEAHRP
ncbi:hypothetical protein HMPREF1318_1788 [Actinomyces massiliensis F0489]|uniref:Uncharacterized protein n=1 Tax=Actinomyces massiliensis F0489 TaxID=1125718 RepID=J1H2N8_9ACTO|nr:hypothetical protein HMPREF1318_1788 [Actinomyces massiliensis F0489]